MEKFMDMEFIISIVEDMNTEKMMVQLKLINIMIN